MSTEWFSRVGRYDVLRAEPAPILGSAQTIELAFTREARSVFNFGVGVGWCQEEFAALGYPFNERGKRANEGLEIIRTLWTEKKATHNGSYYSFADSEMGPKGAQAPHPRGREGPALGLEGHTAMLPRRPRWPRLWFVRYLPHCGHWT